MAAYELSPELNQEACLCTGFVALQTLLKETAVPLNSLKNVPLST